MVVAGVLPGLELGLGDRGLEGDVPEGRCLLQVGLAAGEVAQERPLADLLRLRPDRRVVLVPVDREAERAPQVLEDLLVLPTSCSQSSMKLGRLIGTWRLGSGFPAG